MLDIIGASLLVAFGVVILYLSFEAGFSDNRTFIVLLLGMACIVAGCWLVLAQFSLGLLLKRILGIVLGFVGLFLVIGFPEVQIYQPDSFTKTGIFAGIILFILGLYLMFS